MYVELHAASAFSFLQGASLPETLVERAAALDYSAIALLDADGVYGAPRFHKAATQAGLRAIIGAELTITNRTTFTATNHRDTETPRNKPINSRCLGASVGRGSEGCWSLPVLVESADGYRNLCRLVTRMKMRASKGEGALMLEEFEGYTTGLVALAGRPMLDARRYGVGGLLDRLVGIFGRRNVCVEMQRHLMRDEEAEKIAVTRLART